MAGKKPPKTIELCRLPWALVFVWQQHNTGAIANTMITLCLGICAALAWGLHDFCVRSVSQSSGIFASLLTVLASGIVILTCVAVVTSTPTGMSALYYQLSIASGLCFAVAAVALYIAFSIGPVRLVAPIICAYPILSVGWSAATGTAVSVTQWIAVLTILIGVSGVAILSDNSQKGPDQNKAVIWATTSAAMFAATFGFGQSAVAAGDEALSMLITRTVAFSTVLTMGFVGHQQVKPTKAQLPLLIGMGGLDTLALGCVSLAGLWPHSEYATVTSSIFGMVTIILAWAFLKEPMTRAHWICVSLTFLGILSLGIMG